MSNPNVKSILKSRSTAPVAADQDATVATGIMLSADLSLEMTRSTLQILNKMMRGEPLTEGDKAQMCRIKEVNDILMLYKTDKKEAGEKLEKYRAELTARIRAGVQPAPAIAKRPEVEQRQTAPEPKRPRQEPVAAEPEELYEPVSPDAEDDAGPQVEEGPKPILSLPPSGLPPREFGIPWLQHFFQQMCSKVPYFTSKSVLKPLKKKIVESSEEQRIFVDGMAVPDLLLLFNFVFDLEDHIITKRKSGKNDFTVPHRLGQLFRMPDPLESGLLDSWYFSIPSQCATCALRFANRKILTAHHDYHFVKNSAAQRRRKGLDVAFRGWMETPQDFLGNRSVVITKNFYRKLDPASAVKIEEAATRRNEKAALDAQAVLAELLKNACPADEIKTRCVECDEPFERVWIEDPVSLAVFVETLCVPLFSNQPINFSWPNSNIEIDAEEAATDASKATEDTRVMNGFFIHRKCWEANSKLKNKDEQIRLVYEMAEEVEGGETRAVIQEEQEEEEAREAVMATSAAPRRYF